MLPKKYDPKEAEPRWQAYWEKEKVFAFDPNSHKEIFSIDTPPPTVSGKMHIGHAFSYSQNDFIARFQRMRGKNVFFPFGTDDNGLATEKLIEREKKVKSLKMQRKEFVKLCLETLEDIKPDFIKDWKVLGMSNDFSLHYTTISDYSQIISQNSFIDLYHKGREYRKEAPMMICPACKTAIAQVEMEDAESESALVYIKVKVETGDDLIFATTRPELLPGCIGISVHPDDERYKHLIGKKVSLPLIDREVELTADIETDMEYGSGVVYYCTYGGVECIDWLTRHTDVEPIHIMGIDGIYNEKAGKYHGMTSPQAREEIIVDLKKADALVKLEKITHNVNVHERCGTDIEYVATKQWFIKYLDLKKELTEAGNKLNWHPPFMKNRYDNWVKGLKWDWCISRQRHFGIPIPVWYCDECQEIMLPEVSDLPVDPTVDTPKKKCKCGSGKFTGEKDVFDTWATSSLSPKLAADLFKDHKIYKKLYPMDLRPQAHDIITFWLFNTVVKSQLHDKFNPWHNVMISGWALDPKGKKMSKSKGNVVDPKKVLDQYSADALRFWSSGSKLGDDMPFQEKDLVTGMKFVTKLWNASKFVIMNLTNYKPKKPKHLTTVDMWLISSINKIIKQATDAFEKYEYSKTKMEVEKFFWHTFCDYYLELVKDRIYNPDNYTLEEIESAKYTLYTGNLACLKLVAPIMPHITEEIYHLFYDQIENKNSIHISEWPVYEKDLVNSDAEAAGGLVVYAVDAARRAKTDKQLSLKAEVKRLLIKSKVPVKLFNKVKKDIEVTTSCANIEYEVLDESSEIEFEHVIDL